METSKCVNWSEKFDHNLWMNYFIQSPNLMFGLTFGLHHISGSLCVHRSYETTKPAPRPSVQFCRPVCFSDKNKLATSTPPVSRNVNKLKTHERNQNDEFHGGEMLIKDNLFLTLSRKISIQSWCLSVTRTEHFASHNKNQQMSHVLFQADTIFYNVSVTHSSGSFKSHRAQVKAQCLS